MEKITIDNENQIDQNKLTFNDLAVCFGTGQNIVISGSGRERKTKYRSGVQTKVGDIEISVWKKLVHNLIVRTGEQALFRNLLEWEGTQNYCKRNAQDLEFYALTLHASRIFDCISWVGYEKFNACYRPEVLKKGKDDQSILVEIK